ncbi:MAG: DODA-type extradiol aromatic ring-opening family dioxygenase [Rhodospirillales bacterium]
MAEAKAFPSVFVSHGAPSLVLEGGPACDFLAALGPRLGRPKAVLCVSAHWETDGPAVSAAAWPETIHDFYGFPRPLYAMRYPAPGAPDLARRVKQLLAASGMGCAVDPARGLDHGAWVPMKLMYPQADVPVLQLSIQQKLGPGHHVKLGRALAALRQDGVLVLGSGGAIHNLGELGQGDGPEPWAAAFGRWLDRAVTQGDAEGLAGYREQAPSGARAHPRDEHFLPLFVALGAAANPRGTALFSGFSHGNLGMHAYTWQ